MKTIRYTTGQALVQFLKNQFISLDGKEHRLINGVFGIFGHGNVAGLGQALEEMGGDELPYLQPKNEQAMVHAAIAFAKERRRLGTFACTTSIGPGATNMITGAATATINRLPVLLLPGDIFASRRPDPVLQQLEHPLSQGISVNDCFKPVSKYWDRIQRPEQLLTALPEAMRILSSPGETGAVTICLPQDVQAEAFDWPMEFFSRKVYRINRSLPPQDVLSEASELIQKAKKPLIVAGGGIHYSNAHLALEKFVDKVGVPVCATQAGKGALTDAHELYLGGVGVTGTKAANVVAEEADLIINIGTRLSDFTTASKTQFKNPSVKFISININGTDAYKHGSFPLVGDAREILEKLTLLVTKTFDMSGVKKYKQEWMKIREEIVTKKASSGNLMTQAEVIGLLNSSLDEKSVIVHAAGGLPGDLHKLWLNKGFQDYHSEYGYSCMGYEIAGALGVKLASPEKEVYAVLGDGSYLMLNHEIMTSIQEKKKIVVVLLDNHAYQCIHNLQRGTTGKSFGNEFRHRDEGGRLTGSEVVVDFMANAQSLGAKVWKANDAVSLKSALTDARNFPTTSLIYIPISQEQTVPGFSWWDVPVAETLKNLRENYDEARKAQRFHYES